MPVGKVRPINYFNKIKDIDHRTLAEYYLDVKKIPCLVNSPFRTDKKPSFGIFQKDGKIFFKDFATGESGNIYSLLALYWNMSTDDVFEKIYNDIISCQNKKSVHLKKKSIQISSTHSDIGVKTRDWQDYDIDYWNSYGISKEWLVFAEVYPISLIIITYDDGAQKIYKADKYSYAYVEHKEHNTTIKVYQPFNKDNMKWRSGHDKSVISLWSKLPESGDIVCICSSTKDALCLWANTGIPSVAVQGEGYDISNTAIRELKRRFKTVCVCYDNDDAGIKNAKKISSSKNITNIEIPYFDGGKDISDLFKVVNNKNEFKSIMKNLFNDVIRTDI